MGLQQFLPGGVDWVYFLQPKTLGLLAVVLVGGVALFAGGDS